MSTPSRRLPATLLHAAFIFAITTIPAVSGSSAANGPPATWSTEGPGVRGEAFRGTLRIDDGPTLTSCDGTSSVRLLDATGGLAWELHRELAGGISEALGLAVRGELDAGGGGLVVFEVLRAGPASDACLNAPGVGSWRAWGSGSGGWSAEVRPDGVELLPPGAAAAVTLPPGKSGLAGGPTTFSASGEGHRVRLVLEDAPCRDGRTYAHLRATVFVDGERLEGCAWRGFDWRNW